MHIMKEYSIKVDYRQPKRKRVQEQETYEAQNTLNRQPTTFVSTKSVYMLSWIYTVNTHLAGLLRLQKRVLGLLKYFKWPSRKPEVWHR